ncbi:hypothetical protein LSAT2_021380 [Lamellibrachia satsuma]|nr:hypothetical protein LSAT2_021380 [Lamellibrachia satsuma]
MNKFVPTVATALVVLVTAVAFVNAGAICQGQCNDREVGYKVAGCLPCPQYYECTGNNNMVVKSCPAGTCMKEVIQRCAPNCDNGDPDCYEDAVLGPVNPPAPPAPPALCQGQCDHRDAGYKVGGCLPDPMYYECTGNNNMVIKMCPAGETLKEVIQRCAPNCDNGDPDCYEDAVLAPMMADDTADSASQPCPTGPRGVRSCAGKADKDYQSCFSCNHYVTCVAGRMVGGQRPCPEKIIWDDNLKRCEWTSNTCFSVSGVSGIERAVPVV